MVDTWRGKSAIHRLAKASGSTKEEAEKWLLKQPLYQIYLPVPKYIPRPNASMSLFAKPNDIHQSDLLTRRSRVKISANQRTLPSVLFLSLLFRRWLEAIHRVFHYVNLSNMCSKQTFHSTNLSNVGFFIASQSVRIYLSFQKKPITK